MYQKINWLLKYNLIYLTIIIIAYIHFAFINTNINQFTSSSFVPSSQSWQWFGIEFSLKMVKTLQFVVDFNLFVVFASVNVFNNIKFEATTIPSELM
jgi:hypothetical protein